MQNSTCSWFCGSGSQIVMHGCVPVKWTKQISKLIALIPNLKWFYTLLDSLLAWRKWHTAVTSSGHSVLAPELVYPLQVSCWDYEIVSHIKPRSFMQSLYSRHTNYHLKPFGLMTPFQRKCVKCMIYVLNYGSII